MKRNSQGKKTAEPIVDAPCGWLQLKSLSDFEIVWDGKSLFEEYLSRDTQFTRLMGLLLHYPEQGVDRDLLKRVLLEDSKTDDSAHMLRSVIYNTKQKLKGAMGDSIDYISFKKGRYYWTDKIKVIESAKVFEELCHEAFECEEPGQKLEKLTKACRAYSGDFMPNQEHLNWANEEGQRYRNLFREVMENAAKLLIDKNDFWNLEILSRHAAYVQPLSNWEGLVIGAILGQGNYDAAQDYYESVVPHYMTNLGINPTNEFLALSGKLGLRAKNRHSRLDEIQNNLRSTELAGLDIEANSGVVCIFPVLCGIYQLMERRQEKNSYLMLCTFSSGDDERSYAEDIIDDYTPILKKAVRNVDAVCRFGGVQYIVLFTGGITKEEITKIQKTIKRETSKGRKGFQVTYELREVKPAE